MQTQPLKQEALDAIQRLPDNADIEEIMYRLYVINQIRQGIQEATEGICCIANTPSNLPHSNKVIGHFSSFLLNMFIFEHILKERMRNGADNYENSTTPSRH